MNELEATEILIKYENIETKPQEYWNALNFLGTLHKDEVWESDWNNIWEMFENIREHAKNNGRKVINEDYLVNAKLGWRCEMTDKIWTIKIKTFKDSAKNPPNPTSEELDRANQNNMFTITIDNLKNIKSELLLRSIQTQEGKLNLTIALNSKE